MPGPVYPDGEPDYRETQFGEHGLLSFRVGDEAERLIMAKAKASATLCAAPPPPPRPDAEQPDQ